MLSALPLHVRPNRQQAVHTRRTGAGHGAPSAPRVGRVAAAPRRHWPPDAAHLHLPRRSLHSTARCLQQCFDACQPGTVPSSNRPSEPLQHQAAAAASMIAAGATRRARQADGIPPNKPAASLCVALPPPHAVCAQPPHLRCAQLRRHPRPASLPRLQCTAAAGPAAAHTGASTASSADACRWSRRRRWWQQTMSLSLFLARASESVRLLLNSKSHKEAH